MLEHIIPQDNWKRPCRTCIWFDPPACQVRDKLDFKMQGERTTTMDDSLPCRFHITKIEMQQILDLYCFKGVKLDEDGFLCQVL